MTNQIYQPLTNALNYEKSIIDEIAVDATQYNISHLFDFSSELSATLIGGTTSLISEISETPTLTSQFGNTLETQLNESLTLESEFLNRLETEISSTPNLTSTVFQGMFVTGLVNASLSADAEFTYLIDFTKNISETVSMDKRRTHYVWDGGIILR